MRILLLLHYAPSKKHMLSFATYLITDTHWKLFAGSVGIGSHSCQTVGLTILML